MKRWMFIALLLFLLAAMLNLAVALLCAIYVVPNGKDGFWQSHPNATGYRVRITELGARAVWPEHVDIGWPVPSMKRPLTAFEHVGPIFGPQQHAGIDDLPQSPIWPNFAINTLFYAVLLWLPICGLFVLRCQSRKRRGRCLKCGYPAGTSATCAECGTTSPARRQHA